MQKLGLIIAIIVAIILIVLMVWRSGGREGPPVAPVPGMAIAAPDAGSVTLDGRKWRLKDERGKVVLLDFWATWCGPCVASIPEIKEIHSQFKGNPDFLLVGVSWDDDRASLESFVRKREMPWLQLFDLAADHEMMRKFGITQIPTLYLIDRDGNIAAKDPPYHQLATEIERLLKTPAKPATL